MAKIVQILTAAQSEFAVAFSQCVSFKIRHKHINKLQLIYLTLVHEDLVSDCNLNCLWLAYRPPQSETSNRKASTSFSTVIDPAVH